jgi:hypothetical protein
MDSDEIGGAAGAETSGIGAAAAPGRPLRMTVGRKSGAVLRLLRGEPLEIVAREGRRDGGGSERLARLIPRNGGGEPEGACAGRSGRDHRPATDQGGGADHGRRTAPGEDRAARGRGRRRPFWVAEVEAMSAVISISAGRR